MGWFLAGNGLEGAEDPEAVLASISSLELIQACALIHDDIIDASDSRRGQPTVHRTAEARHRDNSWNGDSAHFGESIAILLGDLAFAWADDMFRTSGLSDAAIARTSNAWRGMRTEVIGGQLLDVFLESAGSESIELAENVNRFKTAAYTIERPLHIGAAIAGADEKSYVRFVITEETSAWHTSFATTYSVYLVTPQSRGNQQVTTCARASALF